MKKIRNYLYLALTNSFVRMMVLMFILVIRLVIFSTARSAGIIDPILLMVIFCHIPFAIKSQDEAIC